MKVGDLVKLKERAILYDLYKGKYGIIISIDITETIVRIVFPCDNHKYFYYEDRLEIISK